MSQQTLILFFILGSSAAIMAWMILWMVPMDRKRKEAQLKALDEMPFNSVSTQEKNAELSEMHASNQVRYQRQIDA